MHMRTLVVNPPERLRLNPSQGRIGAGSSNLCSKESKRRRVAGRIVGFTIRGLFRLSRFKTAALSSSRSGAWSQRAERSCIADLVRRNRAASTEQPSVVWSRLHSAARPRSTEAVHKTVDQRRPVLLGRSCAAASRPRMTVDRHGHPTPCRAASAPHGR